MGSPGSNNLPAGAHIGLSGPISTGGPTELDVIKTGDLEKEHKNLRAQLHSAAEYCEKSYLHSEQKQMKDFSRIILCDIAQLHFFGGPSVFNWVLDNLKDYAVRALVNAIDHLGTVAYKLSDVLEQQTLEISSMDLKVTCLNQTLLARRCTSAYASKRSPLSFRCFCCNYSLLAFSIRNQINLERLSPWYYEHRGLEN